MNLFVHKGFLVHFELLSISHPVFLLSYCHPTPYTAY